MPICTWTSKYSVGIEEIDKQHQKIVLLLNTLYDALKERKEKNQLESILNELVEYTNYHFEFEEELSEKCSNTDNITHIQEHNDLREQVMNFNNNIKAGKEVNAQEIIKFLIDWLTKHIMISDKEFLRSGVLARV